METLLNVLTVIVIVTFGALGESIFREQAEIKGWWYPQWLSITIQCVLMVFVLGALFMMGLVQS